MNAASPSGDAKATPSGPRKKGEDARIVQINNSDWNKTKCRHVKAQYDNHITTSKYSLISFLPRNLFEQFLRVANFYFLVLLILQVIPQISSLSPVTTAIPLVFVLLVTAIKDGFDDYKRHKSDREINNRTTEVLVHGVFVRTSWFNLKVGDIVHLTNNEPIPADIVLIASSSPEGECFVETADLDGETNLKLRQAKLETNQINSSHSLQAFNGNLQADSPNNNLHKFNGSLHPNGQDALSLNLENILLRGCILRNTEHAYGVVVYAGADTKIMLNGGASRFKRTQIDLRMNSLVITIFGILISLCIIGAALNAQWEDVTGSKFIVYLRRTTSNNPTTIGTLQFFSLLIILNTLVPISLYVSVEIIRLGQSKLIDWDIGMYHAETDTPAVARTTTLNEELGQIEYIFSDKTGTLTCNEMNFIKCSIDGVIYGSDIVEGVPFTGFKDDKLSKLISENGAKATAFFRLLAVCHTIQAEHVDGKLEYQAQSPDEKALAEAARDMDFTYEARTQEKVIIRHNNAKEQFELLNIIEFNSTRKRMSVILRTNGVIRLYSKGADNIMRDRLSAGSRDRDWPLCMEHLYVFAKDGLRTLVLAQKDISEKDYAAWAKDYYQAELATEGREEKMEEVANRMEQNLALIGVSAIDDKLQEGVPDAIFNLKRAGIKVWVLTGDKQETAINIGTSCRLLGPEMEPLLIVNGKNSTEVKSQIIEYSDALRAATPVPQLDSSGAPRNTTMWPVQGAAGRASRPLGLVIDGPSLAFVIMPESNEIKRAVNVSQDGTTSHKWTSERLAIQLDIERTFVEIACQCSAVVCCRVSPLQKAQIVNLMKKYRSAVTLAIGDGANDVSMIKAAHVGIGISGHEGRQAVLASDYSIAQFRFLQRLLLVHGRWSYLRMGLFLRYFFYKNFAFTLTHFWFAIFSAWSAQPIYDAAYISIYNVVFTSLPILAAGIFEQDVSDHISSKIPQLYEAGPRNVFFSHKAFYASLLRGTLHSIAIFFVVYLSVVYGYQYESNGTSRNDFTFISTAYSFILVLLVNLQLALEIQHFTKPVIFTLLFGPLLWLLLFWIYFTYDLGSLTSSELGGFVAVFGSPLFWFTMIFVIGVALLPEIVDKFLRAHFFPIPNQIAAEIQKYGLRTPADPPARHFDDPAQHTSYDFSQQDGAGRQLFPANPNAVPSKPMPNPSLSSSKITASAASSSTSSSRHIQVGNFVGIQGQQTGLLDEEA